MTPNDIQLTHLHLMYRMEAYNLPTGKEPQEHNMIWPEAEHIWAINVEACPDEI